MILAITGITGSLAKAILNEQKLLKSLGITRIRGLSRGEDAQVKLSRSYGGEIALDCFLGDVSDRDRMMFALRDAHFVIHAAAQKHIDKFELDVETGYKTNIIGSQNVATAFLNSKNAVSGVLVSTDKACNPITSYGASKLTAEMHWLWHNSFQKDIKFGVARYGNVMGSNGSVFHLWTSQAQRRSAITLTDSSCTRFFIPLQGAAKFVIKTLFNNEARVHIPQMKAAAMMDVAKVVWSEFNKDDCVIKEIGMRSIEKVHEQLSVDGLTSEQAERFTTDELREMYREWYQDYM